MNYTKRLTLVFGLMGFTLFGCMIAAFFALLNLETIHRAAGTDDVEMIQRLLTNDSSLLEARDRSLETPLHRAAYLGRCKAIRVLIQNGANVNSWWQGSKSPDEAYNPLHITAIMGQLEAAQILIEAGTDVNALSIQGNTPLDVANKNGHQQLADLIRSKGGLTGNEVRLRNEKR